MAATTPTRPLIEDFDTSLKALLSTSFDVHDKVYGGMTSQQLWMVWSNKFLSAYTKAKKPTGFYGMFNKFFALHGDVIAVPIFHEVNGETVVNDNWLREDSFKDAPGAKVTSRAKTRAKKPAEDAPISLNEMSRCAGYVVYFDTDNPTFTAVSIPISEIYQCAAGWYREKGKKDPLCRVILTRFLLHLYSIFHNILPDLEPRKEIITKNCTMLKDLLSRLTSSEDASTESTGAGLQGIGKIMAQVMKAAGMSTSGIDEAGINKMLGTALNDNSITGMGKVVGEVIKSVNNSSTEGKGPSDIGNVLDGIGKALQSSTVKSAVSETAAATRETAAKLEASIPTAATVPGGDPPTAKPSLPLPSDGPSFDPSNQD